MLVMSARRGLALDVFRERIQKGEHLHTMQQAWSRHANLYSVEGELIQIADDAS